MFIEMKSGLNIVALVAVAGLLSACSAARSLLGGADQPAPQAAQSAQIRPVNVGNPLSMPPDLQLAVPGQTTEAYQPNPGPTPVVTAEQPLQQAASAPAAPVAPRQDIYEQYGISKVKPDGKPKKAEELRLELKAAIIAKKRQTNPNYGTIANIGNIFSDQ